MSTVIEVPAYGPTANFIVSEANGYRSREQIVVAQGGLYPDGTILQAQDGDEVKYAPFAGGRTAARSPCCFRRWTPARPTFGRPAWCATANCSGRC